MNAPRDKSHDEGLIESLKDPDEAAAYIKATIELGDADALRVALLHVARAHGIENFFAGLGGNAAQE